MKARTMICVGAALLLAAGCEVENYVSIEVVSAKPFQIETGEEDGTFFCVLPEPSVETMLSTAYMDFEDANNTLLVPYHIRNRMPPRQTDIGTIDTNTVVLQRMVVTYRGAPDAPAVTEALEGIGATVPLTVTIESAGGTVVLPLPLIPAELGERIRDAVVPEAGDVETIFADFYLEGRTNAGADIGTATIEFPIVVGFQSGICDDGRCACYRWTE